MNVDVLPASARRASTLLKAMGNEHRQPPDPVAPRQGREAVGELVWPVGLSQAALPQHLARLRRDSLVRTRRKAPAISYAVASDEALAVLEQIHELYCSGQPMTDGHAEEHGHRAAAPAFA